MAYGICLPKKIAAQDVNSLNRSAVSAAAYENGFVGNLLTISTTDGEDEVWTMTAPVTGALSNLWMAWEPEVGDLITLDDNALAGTKSTNGFVVATNTAQALTWAAAAVSGLTLKLVRDPDPISFASGTIGSQRLNTAYMFEVVAVA